MCLAALIPDQLVPRSGVGVGELLGPKRALPAAQSPKCREEYRQRDGGSE